MPGRAWAPRFSYAERYLPPLNRENPASSDFLDRLPALFNGEFTSRPLPPADRIGLDRGATTST
jgi:hypothetical protein